MKRIPLILILFCLLALAPGATPLRAQQAKPPDSAPPKSAAPASPENNAPAYSGMYAFLKEGEFVQVTVEDGGHVTGFISRFGDGESDKGAFLDQFFKTGKLEGSKLVFTTEIVHGVAFDFKGSVDRGDGKNPGDEAYFVLKGTLTQSATDVNKKVTAHSQEVVLKMFPQDAAPAPVVRQ
jgi:hypothetical protein